MSLAKVFLLGMRSAYEMSPEETKHTAHFITPATVEVVRLGATLDMTSSWKTIADTQTSAFNQLCQNPNDRSVTHAKYAE